jgi:dethiobiotin synthase
VSQGIFITGTDTGVGKTLVTAGIVRWLRAQRVDIVPMKPVQTGAEKRDSTFIAPDLEFSLAAANLQPGPDERRLMAPYIYDPACSPHLAGRLAGHYPDIEVIRKSAEILLRRFHALAVEGAGGIMVPLNETQTNLDLMKALCYPVVLVSRIGLGAINHALLSIEVLRQAGISLIGIVFNRTAPSLPEDCYIEEDNPKAVASFGKITVLGEIPYLGPGPMTDVKWKQFAEAMPGLEIIKKNLERGPWMRT